jgi:hypothetical protein
MSEPVQTLVMYFLRRALHFRHEGLILHRFGLARPAWDHDHVGAGDIAELCEIGECEAISVFARRRLSRR